MQLIQHTEVSFYKHLKGELGKAEALRAAQIEMLGKGEYAHPYYWASFGMTGDPGGVMSYKPVRRETAPAKGGGGPCPAGALILALGLGVAFITNRRISL